MKKNRNRNRSNKKSPEILAQETVADMANQIISLYCADEKMKENEMMIANCVQEQGENIALHMRYYGSIVAFVGIMANIFEPICLYHAEDSVTDYGNTYCVDMIARAIYLGRKDSLGLTNLTIEDDDFSFELAAKDYVAQSGLNSVKSFMDRTEHHTTPFLECIDLDKKEEILTPMGAFVGTFTFYKILCQLSYCLAAELCTCTHEMQKIEVWMMVVAIYETSNRIYKKYTEQMTNRV